MPKNSANPFMAGVEVENAGPDTIAIWLTIALPSVGTA